MKKEIINGYLLVEAKETTEIEHAFLPQTSKQSHFTMIGEVLIGVGDVKSGDIVWFAPKVAHVFYRENEENKVHVFIHVTDIFMVEHK